MTMRDPLRSAGQPAQQVQTTNQITGDKRWIALAAVMIAMFFSALDQTVVSTAMPVIISELKGFNLYAWVFTGYILATAVTVPLYGRLSDMYGRKPFYIFGFVVFLVGSAVSGMSTSIGMLIFARAFQGIGAGAMMSMPRATIGDIFNPRERGRWMGLIMGVYGLSTIIGPALGGWITDNWSWHWVFYINMPIALIALGMVIYALPSVRTEQRHHIDWWGSITLAACLVPALLAITFGGTTYSWGSWQVVTLFAVAAVMLVLFLISENRAEEPIIALQFFKNGTFSSTMVVTLMVAMSMFAVMLVLPLYAQGVLGMTAENSGYLMTPMMLSFIVASIIGGLLITRTGKYRMQIFAGGLIMVLGAFLLTRLTVTSHWSSVVIDMVVLGLGIGALMPAMSTIAQNLFPYRVLGTVNATQQMGNSLGGAIASPILGTVLATSFAKLLPQRLPSQLRSMFAVLSPAQRKAFSDPQGIVSLQGQAAIHKQFDALGPTGQALYSAFLHAVRSALTSSIVELFWVGVAFAAAALLGTFLIREIHLKQNEFYHEGGEGN